MLYYRVGSRCTITKIALNIAENINCKPPEYNSDRLETVMGNISFHGPTDRFLDYPCFLNETGRRFHNTTLGSESRDQS